MATILAIVVVALALFFLLSKGTFKVAEGEGFAIYLPEPDIPPAQLAAASYIELPQAPLIAGSDIISYDVEAHVIELSAAAYDVIRNLEVPTSGRSFVVCADRTVVYSGAFWVDLSSQSFGGVVIRKPLTVDPGSGPYLIQLELGYPGPDFFTGEDPRGSPLVFETLRRADKVR